MEKLKKHLGGSVVGIVIFMIVIYAIIAIAMRLMKNAISSSVTCLVSMNSSLWRFSLTDTAIFSLPSKSSSSVSKPAMVATALLAVISVVVETADVTGMSCAWANSVMQNNSSVVTSFMVVLLLFVCFPFCFPFL